MHQRRGTASVEVDRALGPELDHQFGELAHRQPSVDVRAASIAGNRNQPPLPDSERRTRMAADRDVRVELRHISREAFAVVIPVEHDRPVSDEQRAGLQQVALRPRRGRGTLTQTHHPVVDDDSTSRWPKRPGYRLMARRPSVDPQLAQRPVRIAQEEAADHRLFDAVRHAPDVQPLRARKMQYANGCRRARIAHAAHRRHVPIRTRLPPEEILEPVGHRPRIYPRQTSSDPRPTWSPPRSPRPGNGRRTRSLTGSPNVGEAVRPCPTPGWRTSTRRN